MDFVIPAPDFKIRRLTSVTIETAGTDRDTQSETSKRVSCDRQVQNAAPRAHLPAELALGRR